MGAASGSGLTVIKVLAVAAVFGALLGAKTVAEANFSLQATVLAKRHLQTGRTAETDPSFAEALAVLALVATEREVPGSLQQSEQAARTTRLWGCLLLGVSITGLLGLAWLHVRRGAAGSTARRRRSVSANE
ncbi:hypothetical protein [Piscinibacter gummiphilus]|uniref:Uncharacterized protein n=1 Tax=Piscinibacter gummiphilus TaxID=946333 RepID=A0A1W6LDG4_9BURK|nr:hypothetical protein [Piscinibacter gummiphilus]ARN22290.1 hypothetical protein A4W93_21625 [Piscinibacter gummiphilus]ATU66979.1 hypothetical protein CPZ87_21725 [Piscinibacter gummiphilus]GLS94399.1 hypothetical protein GCM10007918_16910 [Piscinibacter gummiphilus]